MKIFLSDQFQIAFWSSLLASLVVAGLVGLVVYQYSALFKQPALSLMVKQDAFYREDVQLTKRADGDYEASFHLAMKNVGRKTIKPGEGYWHLYFPSAEVTGLDGAEAYTASREKTHLRDLINAPVYANSFTDFGPEYKLLVKKEHLNKVRLHYFFESDYGYFPRSVSLNLADGSVPYALMGKIEFVVKE